MDLFLSQQPESQINIPGLVYKPDYITVNQEQELINFIDSQLWLTDLKRRVQHYGYKYDYKARKITKVFNLGPIPQWLNNYCKKLHADNLLPKIPDQVIINEYLPGQGISPHIDCVPCFEENIASISLVSSCVMEFDHIDSNAKEALLLEPRSMILLSKDARYKWQHSIPARKSDNFNGIKSERGRRVSLTFRNVILAD